MRAQEIRACLQVCGGLEPGGVAHHRLGCAPAAANEGGNNEKALDEINSVAQMFSRRTANARRRLVAAGVRQTIHGQTIHGHRDKRKGRSSLFVGLLEEGADIGY